MVDSADPNKNAKPGALTLADLNGLQGAPAIGKTSPIVLQDSETYTEKDVPDLAYATDQVKDAPPGKVIKPDTAEASDIAKTGMESTRAATSGENPLYRFAETDSLPAAPRAAVVGPGIDFSRIGGPGMAARDIELSETGTKIVAKRGDTEQKFHTEAEGIRNTANAAAEAALADLKSRRDAQQAELEKKQADLEKEAESLWDM